MEGIASRLDSVRKRTLALLDRVPDDLFRERVHDFYSPIAWHFGHVGRTEEFWTCCEALGWAPTDERLSFLFADTPQNPKDNRVNVPDRTGIEAYLERTRKQSIRALESADLNSDSPLLKNGFAWEFAYRHECQHHETIAEMLTLIAQKQGLQPNGEPPAWDEPEATDRIRIIGGRFTQGTNDPTAYDNERPAHDAFVPPIHVDALPVTCYQWSEFMHYGGYQDQAVWPERGWAWVQENEIDRPNYWLPDQDETYAQYSPLGARWLNSDDPVSGVSWYEAQAFATWRGKRLPKESEWEFIAKVGEEGAESRTFPWGDQEPNPQLSDCCMASDYPTSALGFANGATPQGALGMAGGVWEWTQSPFVGYTGFRAFPYDGYSKDHMDGGHFVCRGGSFATQGPNMRNTFRNWYLPTYRAGFLGLRMVQ